MFVVESRRSQVWWKLLYSRGRRVSDDQNNSNESNCARPIHIHKTSQLHIPPKMCGQRGVLVERAARGTTLGWKTELIGKFR
jgi:hypothetical protein